MYEFARVLFHMNARKSDGLAFAVNINRNVPGVGYRQIVLRGLPILRQVRIVIIFTVELAVLVNLAIGREPRFDSELHHALVNGRQDARQAQAYRTSVSILFSPERRRAPAEYFSRRLEFAVYLQADYRFILQINHLKKFFAAKFIALASNRQRNKKSLPIIFSTGIIFLVSRCSRVL